MTIIKNIDKHTHIPPERLKLYPPFPDAVKIEVTARCDLKCNFCAVKKGLREVGDMDAGFLYRLLAQFKELGVKQIGLFLLGESFILDNLPDYVRWVKQDYKFPYCFISTNGVAVTPAKAKAVIDAGLDSLKFSVNAGSREHYKEVHGADLFDLVKEHIKGTSEYRRKSGSKISLGLSSIYYEDHADELNAFHKEMSEYVDGTYFLPMYNLAGHVTGGSQIGNVGRKENPAPPVPCWVLFNASKVTWDGWLTACYSDHDERFKLGNLNEKTVLECWYGKKAVHLRWEHLNNQFTKDSLCAPCLGKV